MFNSDLKFSERSTFILDDSNIAVKDYERMWLINRKPLTTFLMQTMHGEQTMEPKDMEAVWADECVDEGIKELLSDYEKGAEIPLDMVCHMEYFYNTLDCHFKV